MADTAYRLSGEYREATVTSLSYTVTTGAPLTLAALGTRGQRRLFYNNSASQIHMNKTGVATTGTTVGIIIKANSSYEDTLYMGQVMFNTSSAVTVDLRVEQIVYNAY